MAVFFNNRRWIAIGAFLCSQAVHAAAPSPTVTYAVRNGDTLISLARAYMVRPQAWRQVQADNHVGNPHGLRPGQVLRIRRELLRTRPITQRVIAFSGPVNVLRAGETVVVAASAGMLIPDGSTIATGRNGFVTLSGSDGSRVSLPSHSEICVRRSRQFIINAAGDVDLEVRQGRADVRAAKQAPQGEFRLRTPIAVSAVRGTQFRASFSPDDTVATTEVLEGTVGVDSGPANAVLPAGRGLAARPSGIVEEALLPAPDLVRPGKVQTDPALSFRVKLPAGAALTHLQVARDAGFLDVVAETEATGETVTLPSIANGNWFLRASARAPSGIEGLPETWAFRRQRVGLTAASGPAGIADGFRFDWQAEGDGESLYRFQLFRDGQSTAFVDQPALTQTGITLTHLPDGVYRWRVAVLQVGKDGSAEVWTPLQKFSVSN